jgi:protein gp37
MSIVWDVATIASTGSHSPTVCVLPNVWLGVSVEDQRRADERIPDLLATPAAVRFISAEPLLGPVDLKRWMNIMWQIARMGTNSIDGLDGLCGAHRHAEDRQGDLRKTRAPVSTG